MIGKIFYPNCDPFSIQGWFILNSPVRFNMNRIQFLPFQCNDECIDIGCGATNHFYGLLDWALRRVAGDTAQEREILWRVIRLSV